MASTTLATAFAGLWVAIGAVELISFLDQLADAMNLAQAPPLDAAIEVVAPLVAIGAFEAAVTLVFLHLGNGGGGDGWIPEVVTVVLCASAGAVVPLWPGAMDGLAQAVRVVLPGSATATFFLSITSIYMHAHTVDHGARGGAGDGLVPASVKAKLFITKVSTLAATLVTAFLALVAAILAFYTKQ